MPTKNLTLLYRVWSARPHRGEKGLISETEIYERTDMQIEICGPSPIKRRESLRGLFVQLSGMTTYNYLDIFISKDFAKFHDSSHFFKEVCSVFTLAYQN